MKPNRFCCVAAVVLLGISISCGRDRSVLARVGDREIGPEAFREAFASLSPEDQVAVLQPGGRTALLDRLVTKNLLELAWDSSGSSAGSTFWIDLYETSWLAGRWAESAYGEYMEAGTDTTALLALTRGYHLTIVLLPDSSSAAATLVRWMAGGPSAPEATALAPWSERGSSYRVMEGALLNLAPDLESACAGHEGAGPFAFPVYGVWAVAAIDTSGIPSDTLPAGIGTYSFMREVEERCGIRPESRAIETLASRMVLLDGAYSFDDPEGLDGSAVLASWDGGSLTAAEVADLFEAVRPDSFFGGEIPAELGVFAPPEPTPAGAPIDLWFYVTRVSQARWEAGQGAAAGLDPDSAEVGTMAAVEDLLRREVIRSVTDLDSTDVMDYYGRNRGRLVYPERRSVILAYVPSEVADSLGEISGFGALEPWTLLDTLGRPVPTPQQPAEAFGPIAGAVFAADSGMLTGPVETGTEGLVAFFEVLFVSPPDTAEASEVWDLLESGARMERIEQTLSEYISELRSEFGVEIDSTAVEAVDPWGSSY
jgi:hypothetical protein